MKPWRARIPLALLLVAVLPGCEHFRRTRDCRNLARTMNPVLTSIDAARRKAPEDAATYRGIAAQYEGLVTSVAAAVPAGRRVSDMSLAYQGLFRQAATDARDFADALDSKDPRRVATVRLAATKTTKHEAQVISQAATSCARR